MTATISPWCVDHLRVVLDLHGRPRGQDFAEVHHVDPGLAAQLHDHLDVVLNEDDAEAELLVDAADQLGEVAALVLVHARRRLVQQQELRIGGHGAHQLQPALQPVGQVAGVLLGVGAEPDQVQQPVGALDVLLLAPDRTGGAEQGVSKGVVGSCVEPQGYVLEHRHLGKQADILESPADAQVAKPVRGDADDGLPVEKDLSAGGRHRPGDQVQQRGLAGSVGADEAKELAPGQGQVDVVHRPDPAELDRYALEFQDVGRSLGCVMLFHGGVLIRLFGLARLEPADGGPEPAEIHFAIAQHALGPVDHDHHEQDAVDH